MPGRAGARAYDVDGSGLVAGPLPPSFEASDEVIVLDDGSSWPRVAAAQLFWFAWFGQHPETSFWPVA